MHSAADRYALCCNNKRSRHVNPEVCQRRPWPDETSSEQVPEDAMRWPTHEVSNQTPTLASVNLFDIDPALHTAALRELAPDAVARLSGLGRWAGSPDAQTLAQRANRFPPQLKTMTGKAIASTRLSSIRPGTRCWPSCARAACRDAPGKPHRRTPMSSAHSPFTCMHRLKPAACVR